MEKRIIELMKHYGLSPAQFADKIGVQRSSISHILSGRNKPSYDFLQKITTVFTDIDANWLLNGVGSIDKLVEKTISNITEQDLFSQQLSTKEPLKKQIEKQSINQQIPVEPHEVKERQVVENSNKIIEFTNVNSVKQIILIYENNTFEIINKN